MTVLPRGARNRRGGRRPGWLLLTALLVLAILASATLVFTSSVQLLRLAVILSLWAAVIAAFVSVLYRRQSEVDEARARDMKFVYDLQLDREIAARREYELGVEAHLRRQLAGERGQAADELMALRAELASLRSNLEVLLGAELGDRPAIEAERLTPAAESVGGAFAMPPPPGKVESSRVTSEVVEERTEFAEFVVEVSEGIELGSAAPTSESPIIDVPEEPLSPPVPPRTEQPHQPTRGGYRGSHRRTEPAAEPVMASSPQRPPQPPASPPPPVAPWRPPETQPRRGRHWTPDPAPPPPRPPRPRSAPPSVPPVDPARGRHWVDASDAAAAAAATEAKGKHRDAAEQVSDRAAERTEEPAGLHTGGHSVADLMARLNLANPAARGGRRRRED